MGTTGTFRAWLFSAFTNARRRVRLFFARSTRASGETARARQCICEFSLLVHCFQKWRLAVGWITRGLVVRSCIEKRDPRFLLSKFSDNENVAVGEFRRGVEPLNARNKAPAKRDHDQGSGRDPRIFGTPAL